MACFLVSATTYQGLGLQLWGLGSAPMTLPEPERYSVRLCEVTSPSWVTSRQSRRHGLDAVWEFQSADLFPLLVHVEAPNHI